jgi:hypothetical protein
LWRGRLDRMTALVAEEVQAPGSTMEDDR